MEVKNEEHREHLRGIPEGGPGEAFISISRMSSAQDHVHRDRAK
jgi:hypothetical protein